MKKLTFIKFALALLLLLSPLVPLNALAASGNVQQNALANLKDRADREIDRRVTSLTALMSRITDLKRLTAGQKSSFSSQIQANISDLERVKTKIANDSDLAAMRSDVKSITESYRIYLVFIPKIHFLAAIDATASAQTKLGNIATELDGKLKTLAANGADVSHLQADLNDMNARLSDASSQTSALENKLITVTPDGYPGNRTVLVDGKNTMASIRKDLADARADARKIVDGIKSLAAVSQPAQ